MTELDTARARYERSFLAALDRMQCALASSNDEEALQAATPMRQLLLDGHPLVHQVRRFYPHRLDFGVVEHPVPPEAVRELFAIVDLDPMYGGPDSGTPTSKNLDQFLGTTVGKAAAYEYTIHDLIDYVCNVMGVVHTGTPRGEVQAALEEAETRTVSGRRVFTEQLRGVGRIVLVALSKLRYDVLGLSRYEGSPGISIHLAVATWPMPEDLPNFILDLGTSRDRNRISLFMDSREDLTLSYRNADTNRQVIHAGAILPRLPPGRFFPVHLNVAVNHDELFLLVRYAGWSHILLRQDAGDTLSDELAHYVIGSDVQGGAPSNIAVMELFAATQIPSADDMMAADKYLRGIASQGTHITRFEGNQFLHSMHHPNFSAGER